MQDGYSQEHEHSNSLQRNLDPGRCRALAGKNCSTTTAFLRLRPRLCRGLPCSGGLCCSGARSASTSLNVPRHRFALHGGKSYGICMLGLARLRLHAQESGIFLERSSGCR